MTSDNNALRFRLPRNALLKKDQLDVPKISRVYGVFADISGYTPFAEDLIRNHRERGIGQLVDELEKLLIPAADAAIRNRGNLISVEGDALLITFDELKDLFGFLRDVTPFRQAVARTQEKEYPLLMDIGVAHGSLFEFIAGDMRNKRYIAAGSALSKAYVQEEKSKEGDISLNFEVEGARKVGDSFSLLPKDIPREGLIKRLFGKRNIDPAELSPDGKLISKFSSSVIPLEPRAQLLSPVIIFSDFPLIPLALSLAKTRNPKDLEKGRNTLNDFFKAIQDIVETKAEGYIDKFKDNNSMFLFGAPKSHVDARLRAFEAVSKIHDIHKQILNKYGFPVYPCLSGMHTGEALCGPVLGRYTAIGNSVNIAARIKASSNPLEVEEISDGHKKIRFSSAMLSGRVAQFVRGYELERAHLKGIEDTRTIFGFSTIVEFGKSDEFILREDELGDLIEKARSSIGHTGASINVIGGIGSGRDRLVSLLAQNLKGEFDTFEIRCSPFYKKEPYRALFELMKKVYPVFTDEDLFNHAIGKRPESGEDFSRMLDEFRKRLESTPAAYIINNGDNIDRESADFLKISAQKIADSGSLIAYSGIERLFENGQDLVLGNLTKNKTIEFARTLAKKMYPETELSDNIANELYQRSGGNPLFISELVKSLHSEFGKARLRRRITGDLRSIMLKNVQDLITSENQAVLERYSLMHSVATMAPLTDSDFENNLALFQKHGLLNPELEFSSDLLRSAIADSMDPRKKQGACLELARTAESAEMADSRAIFEYYRHATLTDQSRMKALKHADKYIQEKGFLYLVPQDLYDDAVALANTDIEEQRHICGMMLYRKVIFLNAQYADDRHKDKIKRMQSLVDLARKSEEYLFGHAIEYKAKLQTGTTLSFLAYFEKLEGADTKEVAKKLGQSRELIEQSRQMALDAGDIIYYLAASSSLSHLLIYHHENPGSAFLMLKDTEWNFKKLSKTYKNENLAHRVANLYMSLSDAAQMMNDYPGALEFADIAINMNKTLNYTEGLCYSLGTKAKILVGMKDMWGAKDFAMQTLDIAQDNDILIASFIQDMKKIIEDANRLIAGVSGEIS